MRLFLNHLRRSFPLALLVSAAVFGFQFLIVRISLKFLNDGGGENIMRLVPKGMQSFLGIDQLPISTMNGFLSVAYQHPFFLAALIAIPVAIGSALLTGEVEKKTMALLLTRPVSRVSIVISATVAAMIWSAIAVVAACAGSVVSAYMLQQEGPEPRILITVGMNLFALLIAVVGLSVFFASLLDERSDAMGWTITIVLGMYVWNFLAQTWPFARDYRQFSIFTYFTPTRLFQGGAILLYDLQVLAIVGVAGVIIACLVYGSRDFNV